MQHLDEGTIHAWLDGALTPEETARAEAHVKDCPQCQAAVAEARGFIAASSRILTALDNAPRGVIPAAAPARRVQPWVWRVAATVLVVAMGSLLLVKQRTNSQRISDLSTTVDSTAPPETLPFAPPVQILGKKETAQESSAQTAGAVNQNAAAHASPTQAAQPPRATSVTPRGAPAPTGLERSLSTPAAAGRARSDAGREAASTRARAEERSPVSAPPAAMNAPTYGALSSIVVETPRQVALKRAIGSTQTFYEVAPGDTVILEEQSSANLQSVVTTGVATTRSAQPMLRAGKAAAVAESQKTESAVPAAAPAPPVAAMQDADVGVGEIHRISWLDPSSGRVLILSGRHSQEELQKFREQIQRLRAAAQSKKLPD